VQKSGIEKAGIQFQPEGKNNALSNPEGLREERWGGHICGGGSEISANKEKKKLPWQK